MPDVQQNGSTLTKIQCRKKDLVTLKMWALRFTETSANSRTTIQRYIPQELETYLLECKISLTIIHYLRKTMEAWEAQPV
jgi:hypothetical protein